MLARKIALITGGSSGLGLATAKHFIAQGGSVFLLDLPSSEGEKILAELGENARFYGGDVTSEDDVKSAIAVADEAFSGLNTIVNCAGIGTAGKVLGKKGVHSLDSFAKTLHVNVSGTFNVVRLGAERLALNEPYTEDGERGVIINTASIAAYDGQIGQAAYAASKGAVVSMTLPIARELAAHGIRVNTIAPGLFMTPMLAGLPEKVQNHLGQQIPFPAKLGDPKDYAKVVDFLVTNNMMNGETIRCDGAFRMPP